MPQNQSPPTTPFWDARAPIYLIESPSPEDLYAGRNEGHSLVYTLSLGAIEVTYFLATNVDRFEQALKDIGDIISRRVDCEDVLPFVHISAHGSDDGVELTDGDVILWPRLSKLLCDLHDKIGSCSVVGSDGKGIEKCSLSLSSCSAYTNFIESEGHSLPVQAVLGPTTDVEWCQSLVAFSSFYYQAFVLRQSFSDSVLAMNAASSERGKSIFALSYKKGLSLVGAGAPVIAQRFAAEAAIATGFDRETLDTAFPTARQPSEFSN